MKARFGRAIVLATATALMATLSACGSTVSSSSSGESGGDDGNYTIVTVSKVEGIPWFERMNQGVQQFGKDNSGVSARQTGPSTGDSAQQIQIVQDLIAQNVDAIVVVPNDPQGIAPVLKQARDKGIVVITHEAPALAGTESVDYDLEAFDNTKFGEQMYENLAKSMGGKGTYVTMVASLTNETHMAWYEAGTAYLKKNYPDMKPVTDTPYEDNNDDAVAQSKSLEILKAHPDLGGFAGMSVSAGSNFAAAIKDKNMTNIAVSTLSVPSISDSYLAEGWMDNAQGWDPMAAGYAANILALKLLKGEKIESTVDLKANGFASASVTNGLVTGDGIVSFTSDSHSSGKYPY
ncbi:substrate-binding domain-containing protein [Schaalia sp. ZJ405]|uniref:substrate-binding domain-containing protein n=1 Tax=unclassified Schaalia TaxID=2691889 RepID=UPI0013ED76A1|nr:MULTISPECIES: substrate-binding domain-containing protein [unclassified Schaalia]QPK81293.1 substrate-binding domain-containing protein [Schaalia sp. ZJ405]